MLEECGSLERTDFLTVGLEGTDFFTISMEECGGLERTHFYIYIIDSMD